MSIFEGILYGLLQGIAEFLPISSSGHLALAQNLFGAANTEGNEYLAFNVLLHLATLAAVCTVYRKDVWLVIKGFFSLLFKLFKRKLNLKRLDYGEKLCVMLVFATLPLIPAILIKDWLEAVSSVSWAIGLLLIINGLVLFISDKLASNKFSVAKANPVKAFYPGVAQVFGLLPGISRSGITITGSLLGGFNRKDVINYIEKMKNIKFNNNDLRESEFINTPLKDIDLSNSNIEGIKVNPAYLKGLTVNTYQAIDLSKLLGINIR